MYSECERNRLNHGSWGQWRNNGFRAPRGFLLGGPVVRVWWRGAPPNELHQRRSVSTSVECFTFLQYRKVRFPEPLFYSHFREIYEYAYKPIFS